ncbi:MAG: hypothetical protein MJY56_05905 [Bacteroidales bacterium]|nr:hypothetical protein [Bacteroidales bacterium]
MLSRKILSAIISVLALVSCAGGDYLAEYWSDRYEGPLGIQVDTTGIPAMTLAGEEVHMTGVNCYSLFLQCIEDGFPIEKAREALEYMAKEEVPVARFSAGPFTLDKLQYYIREHDDYLSALDSIASIADSLHVGLVASIFWNPTPVSEYYGEPLRLWGDRSSRTFAYMLKYTDDVVSVLSRHKSLFFWEFGNELNLGTDHHAQSSPDFIGARDVENALSAFAEKVMATDPARRMVGTGHSIMRDPQYHLMNGETDCDSYEEYKKISSIMTPLPMRGMSEHIYGEPRTFSDRGTLSKREQFATSRKAAGEIGKAYYIGEFSGPALQGADSLLLREYHELFYAADIQLSMMWNFSVDSNAPDSFYPDTEESGLAFGLMREFNSIMASGQNESE